MIDTRKKIFAVVQDYTVSKETFGLYMDPDTDMLITFPKPKTSALGKYYESQDYISHTDSTRNAFDKAYQIVKNIAIKNKVKLIDGFCKEKGNLLDIGAGTGDFLVAAKKDGWNTTAVEPNAAASALIQKKGLICYHDTTVLTSGSFDVISMWHVLEHVPDVDAQLRELKRLLKPNGTILVAVPNYKSFDAKYYGRFWAAFDVPRHLWHFSKNSIKIIFAKHGFLLAQVLPMWFDAFYVSMLSEKYMNGKINFFNAFLVGLKSNLQARKTKQFSSQIYLLKVTT